MTLLALRGDVSAPPPLAPRRETTRKVDALCWLTATEPSGRWGLLRDVMENQKTTKVLVFIFADLACVSGAD